MNEYYEYHQLLNDYQKYQNNMMENMIKTPNWKFVFMTNTEIPLSFIDLISNILKYDPNERIHPFQALNHPCFDDLKRQYEQKNEYVIPSTMFELNEEEMEFAQTCKGVC
mmetsp:Transcript_21402/g.18861  ORF Transcript_21402/g.18861 Transcript_21402/m.18861 type:complete len:110 (-) Transcript_21402:118-447(-)